jgi:hypothetical protein
MTLPRRKTRPKMGVRQDSHIRSEGHMRWVRSCFNCSIEGKAGHVCSGPVVSHHCREGANGGTALKPDDSTVVPLCDGAHAEIHRGWRTFEAKYGVDLSKVAADLWKISSHRKKWEALHG